MKHRKQIASMLIAYRYAKNQTQTKVANKLNVTFQQVQKYETTQNGISSEKLLKFCEVYDLPLGNFQTGDPFAILEGADIPIHYKEKAMEKIEKLEEVKHDKSRSHEDMVGQSLNPRTYL